MACVDIVWPILSCNLLQFHSWRVIWFKVISWLESLFFIDLHGKILANLFLCLLWGMSAMACGDWGCLDILWMTDVKIYIATDVHQVYYSECFKQICRTECKLITHEWCTKMNNNFVPKIIHCSLLNWLCSETNTIAHSHEHAHTCTRTCIHMHMRAHIHTHTRIYTLTLCICTHFVFHFKELISISVKSLNMTTELRHWNRPHTLTSWEASICMNHDQPV